MTRRLLMTTDEARAAVVVSALGVIRSIDCDLDRTIRLLRGRGRATGLSTKQRKTLAEHRLLVRALQADGLGGIVDEEIDGLASLLEREWMSAARSEAS